MQHLRPFLLATLLFAGCDGGAPPPDATTGFDAGPPQPCASPGAIETVACGSCGTVERFCTASGTWAYGICQGEGQCAPGSLEARACGACGTQTARCTSACVWEATSACEREGECLPGQRTRGGTGCPAGQTRDLVCGESCAYVGEGACTLDSCPTPGALERVACGRCGMQDRFCTAAGAWEYSVCEESGECTPGTTRTAACGVCGTRSERCVASCTWDTSGECSGGAACAPGETRRTSEGCPVGQSRVEICDAACSFQPSGGCEGASSDGGRCGVHLERCVRNEDCCSGVCYEFPLETACFG